MTGTQTKNNFWIMDVGCLEESLLSLFDGILTRTRPSSFVVEIARYCMVVNILTMIATKIFLILI